MGVEQFDVILILLLVTIIIDFPLSVTGLRDAEVSMEFVVNVLCEISRSESGSVGVKFFEASESWKPVTLMGVGTPKVLNFRS